MYQYDLYFLNTLHPHQDGLLAPILLELLFWMGVMVLALVFELLIARRSSGAMRLLGRLARHRTACIVMAGVLAVAGRIAILPLVPFPSPAFHDEFSYLLQADTFAHGRLTNPTPVMWPFLEAFHENMQPTYQSMYPPAQGFFLFI